MCPCSVYRFGQNKLKGFKISAFLIFSRTFYFKLFFYTTFWLSVLDLKHSVKKRIKLKDLSVIIRFIYMRRPVWHATWCHRKNSISQHFITEKLHRSKNSFTTKQKNTRQCNYIQQFGKLCIKYTWISAFFQTTPSQSSEKYNIQTIKTHTQKAEAKKKQQKQQQQKKSITVLLSVCFSLLQLAVTTNVND